MIGNCTILLYLFKMYWWIFLYCLLDVSIAKYMERKRTKYDLRDWASEHEKMGKGVTLTAEELKKLRDILNNMNL